MLVSFTLRNKNKKMVEGLILSNFNMLGLEVKLRGLKESSSLRDLKIEKEDLY